LEQKRAELQRSIEDNTVEIWPEHRRCCELFFAMGTQWNLVTGINSMNGGSHYQGLKYEVLDLVEQRLPADPDAPAADVLFAQLQTLEREALKHLNQD
jgi:hypothetical protein